MTADVQTHTRVSTGVGGLDEILSGGLISNRSYLVRGGPGTGKTTLGMHFLSAGVKRGERVLYITLGESEASLRSNAASIGIDTSRIEFLDLSPNSQLFSDHQSYDLFSPAEVERDPVTREIVERVRSLRPQRVFLDSTSHLRYLAIDSHQFRKQLLAFIRFLLEQDTTIAFTSEATLSVPDDDVMYLCDGIIQLTMGDAGRKVEVTKFRGSSFRPGAHTLRLTDRGFDVFSILRPIEHSRKFPGGVLTSGVEEMDRLLHGGIEKGTVTVLTGPAGVGKTTLGLQFLREAAKKGQRSVIYTFEESVEVVTRRAETVGIPLHDMIAQGCLSIVPIEPLLYTSDEVAFMIRDEVENQKTEIVMFDSISGYRLAVPGENLVVNLRGIFKYITNMGATVLAVNEIEAITGDFRATEIGISFMVDNIVFIRYLELGGEMRKAIGVLKKRLSDFERHLREFAITSHGIRVGEPLVNLRGILLGVPEWVQSGNA